MYRCCECGAYLDRPLEPHERQRPEDDPKRRGKRRGSDYDQISERQLAQQQERMKRAWQEWDAN